MTKTELLEALLVERHLPLPPSPRAGIPHDDPRDQHARRTVLLDELEEFENNPGRKRPANDEAPRMVQRKGVWVADRSAA